MAVTNTYIGLNDGAYETDPSWSEGHKPEVAEVVVTTYNLRPLGPVAPETVGGLIFGGSPSNTDWTNLTVNGTLDVVINADLTIAEHTTGGITLKATDNALLTITGGTAATAFAGQADTPDDGDIRDGVSYAFGIGSGNLVVPTAGQTKVGIVIDDTDAPVTGTYTGADRNTDPGENLVLLGTAYKSNSTSNNKTGTLTLPPEAAVETGNSYGDPDNQQDGELVATPGAGIRSMGMGI